MKLRKIEAEKVDVVNVRQLQYSIFSNQCLVKILRTWYHVTGQISELEKRIAERKFLH